MVLPNSFTEAKRAGAKHYFTGKECKHGHVSNRVTKTGCCVECVRLASLAWLAARPGKSAEYTRAYRLRNPDVAKSNDARTAKARRAEDPSKFKKLRLERYRATVKSKEGREVRTLNRLSEAEVVSGLVAVHGAALEYVEGYIGKQQLAVFRCVVHGTEFSSTPNNILRGANPCPQCNHMKSSQEDAIARYLAIFTPVVQRDRTLIKPFELDIYLPEKKLAVEYCGMYWHSHFSAADEKKDKLKHFRKYEACRALGVRLITVYESEWLGNAGILKRLLRNAIGESKGRLMARKCELRTVPSQEAGVFYGRYHPQGGQGHGEHFGLYWNGALVACMRFTFGINDRGAGAKERSWTLSRYATRVTVAGAASRLFQAFIASHKPKTVKSFSDNRYFGGSMYQALGFALDTEVPPDYQVWSPKRGLLPKPHYQRRAIPKRLKEHGVLSVFDPDTDIRTESEMTFLMGCGRIYDCGKKRWVWNA